MPRAWRSVEAVTAMPPVVALELARLDFIALRVLAAKVGLHHTMQRHADAEHAHEAWAERVRGDAEGVVEGASDEKEE